MKKRFIVSVTMLSFFMLSSNAVSSDIFTAQGKKMMLIDNSKTDKHNYKHPNQGTKGKCESGPNAITISNKTNYPVYYDLNPGSNGGKRLVDWRIQPGESWNHCRPGNMVVEFDYLFSQAGVQAKSFAVKLGQKYRLVKVGEGVVDLKKQ